MRHCQIIFGEVVAILTRRDTAFRVEYSSTRMEFHEDSVSDDNRVMQGDIGSCCERSFKAYDIAARGADSCAR